MCALVQENVALLNSIRENMMMGRFFDNHQLMIAFDKNVKEVTALLGTLPFAEMQKLPVQVRPAGRRQKRQARQADSNQHAVAKKSILLSRLTPAKTAFFVSSAYNTATKKVSHSCPSMGFLKPTKTGIHQPEVHSHKVRRIPAPIRRTLSVSGGV